MKFFVLFIFFCANISFAQTAPKAYLTHDGGVFEIPKLHVDNKVVKYGEMAEAFKDNPEAYQYAKKYEEQMILSQRWLWGGLGAAIVYLTATARHDFQPAIYWGIFATGFFTGGYYSAEATSNFYKAINAYNGITDTPEKIPAVGIGFLKETPNVVLNWFF
ncbi:MAG: hypothetical protein ACXVCP_13060 [Bdellovibrio sp.]